MSQESDLLQQILDELRAQKSMSGAASGLDDFEDGLGESAEALKAHQKAEREAAEAAAKFAANMQSALKNVVGALGSFGSALTNVTGKFGDFGQGLDSLGDAALDVGKNFGAMGLAAGLAVKAITSVTNAALKQSDALLAAKSDLMKLGGAGIGTAKDIGELAHQSKISSKNLQMLVEPMKSLSGNFLSLGTTVGEGQKKFMQMTAVTEEQRKAFGRLGLSQQELMQSQADFVKLQRSSGIYMRAQEKDARKLQQASLEYTENLVKLAAISGQDLDGAKKAQEVANMQNAENIRTTQESIKIRKLEEQAAKEADPIRKKRLLDEAKNIEVEQKARKEMIAQVTAQTDEATGLAYAQYMATGTINETVAPLIRQGNDLAEQRRRIQAAAGDENKMREATARNMTDLNKNYEKTIEGIGSAAQQSDQIMKDWGISTTRNANFVSQQGRNEKEARDKAATDVANQMRKGTDPMADAQQTVLETQRSVAVGLDELLLKVNPLTKEYGLAMIAVGALTAAVVTATMAFKGLQGGGGLLSRVLGGGASAAKGTPGTNSPYAPPGAGGAGGIGNAIGNIGQGAGRGLQGLLQGAATGLTSFANPMVVAGAAGMGAAIAVIGAGIAGATWLMGKALPTLAEGFEAFTEIDGDKLLATGKGVGALGAGLAVFGVGGAAAGFGAIAQSIGDGLLSFFGGKTPFQRIEEFSKLDINAEKVKENAEAFAAFGGAMTKVGAAGAAQGIGSAVGALGSALGSLMGGQSSLEQLKEFSQYDLGSDGYIKVKQNAEAMVAFGNAMSEYKGTGQSTLGKLGDSVASYFQVKPPIEQMKEFMSVDLGKEGATKVKNNAEAFTAFANAMAAFQGAAGGGLSEAWSKKISQWFELKPPVEQMQDFAKVQISKEQVDQIKLNAEAFGAFAGAMSSYQGGANTGVMEGLSDWVQMNLDLASPMQKLEAFSKIKLSEDSVAQVKRNADAFVAFSTAMQQYKGSASEGLMEAGFNFVKKALGGDSSAVFKKFEEFTKLDVDPDKAQKISQAFMQYAIAMAAFKDSNQAKQALKQATSQAVAGLAGSPAASTAGTPTPAATARPTATPARTAAAAPPAAKSGTTPTSAPAAAPAAQGAGTSGIGAMLSRVSSFLGFGGDKGADANPTGTGSTTVAAGGKGGPGGTMSDQDVKNMIKAHEGVRYEPYRDSLGLWTVGVGHLIGDGRSLPAAWNRRFSEQEVNTLFDQDYEKHKRQAQSNVPGFNKYDSLGQAAFIDLTFNMGPGWPNKFKNTSKKIEMGDAFGAARGLEDSLWYRQVGNRGPKIVSMVENSKVKAKDGGIASGPDSGFPATLHGKEMIVPLSGDSLLEKLGTMSSDALKNEASDSAQKMESLFQNLADMNQRSTSEWISRLDKVIDVLENSRTTQEKTLRVIRT